MLSEVGGKQRNEKRPRALAQADLRSGWLVKESSVEAEAVNALPFRLSKKQLYLTSLSAVLDTQFSRFTVKSKNILYL